MTTTPAIEAEELGKGWESGTGKTHFLEALGHAAIDAGHPSS